MMEGLRPGPLFDSLSKNILETQSTLQNKPGKYIAPEELSEAKWGKDKNKRKEPNSHIMNYKSKVKSKRSDQNARGGIICKIIRKGIKLGKLI